MQGISLMNDETKRLFVDEIKKYPEVWENRDRGARNTEVWGQIEEKFGLPSRTARVLWRAFRRRYFNILLMRTIQRDNRICTWHLFHNMSFLYEHVKAIVEGKMGGISPPLLNPDNSKKDTLSLSCPCCMPICFEGEIDTNSPEVTADESENGTGQLTIPNIDVEDLSDSLEAHCLEKDKSINPLKRRINVEESSLVSESSQPMKTRKTLMYNLKDVHSIERANIIDAIKEYPVLYDKDSPGPKCSLSFAWKKVAEKVGIPLLIIQNRWRLFKRRYVEELMRQRYTNGEPFHSNWSNFDQMSFMLDHIKADIENINKIREEIQQILEERKSQQTIDLCTDEDVIYLSESENENSDTNAYEANVCSDQHVSNRGYMAHTSESPKSDEATQNNPSPRAQPVLLDEAPLSKEELTNVDDNKEPGMLTLYLISDDEDEDDTYLVESEYVNCSTDTNVANESYTSEPPKSDEATENNHSSPLAEPALFDEVHLSTRKPENIDDNKEPTMLTLDLISGEEGDSDNVTIISLGDDNVSLETNSSADIYEKEVVYFEESIKDDFMCIDDYEDEVND